MKFRKTISVVGALAGAAAIYGGWLAYLAWRDLVTLDVRNMDVRLVVKKIERQTWESISVDKNVDGKVTLNVTRKPLPQVLRMIADQTFSRPAVLYPLYSNGRSLAVLREALRGEADAATQGWKSLQARGPMDGGPMMFMGPMFGGGFPGPNAV